MPDTVDHVWVTIHRDRDAAEHQVDACSRCGAERHSEWGTLPTFRPPHAETSCGALDAASELEAARNLEPDCAYGAVGAGRYAPDGRRR